MSTLHDAVQAQPANRQATPVAAPLERREFCRRFKASVLLRVGQERFSDGCKISEYADETAPAYWDKPVFRLLGPEMCAESDMRYWHDI